MHVKICIRTYINPRLEYQVRVGMGCDTDFDMYCCFYYIHVFDFQV